MPAHKKITRLKVASKGRAAPVPPPTGDDPLLTLPEVAALCRTAIGSVRHWIREGRLKSTRPGRRVLVRRSEVLRLLAVS